MPHPKVKISDNSGNTVGVDTSSNALNVKLVESIDLGTIGDVDVLSVIPGTGATNLGKAEDAAHTSGDVGVMPLAVRNDTRGTLVSQTADYSPLQLNSDGDLRVESNINAAVGTTKAFNQGGATTASGQVGVPSLARMNDEVSAPSGHGDNEWSFLQTNLKGALYITGGEVESETVQSQPLLMGGRFDTSARTIGNGEAGAVALDASGHVNVTGTYIINDDSTQASTPPMVNVGGEYRATLGSYGNGDATILQSDIKGRLRIAGTHVDDAAFTLGTDSGIMMMGFAGAQSIDTNDAAALQCDTAGRLMVEIDSTTVDTDTCFRINGEAWDNVDIGVGVYAVRNDTLVALSNVADGDYTPFQVDAQGALYTTHGMTGMVSADNNTISDSTAEQLDGSTSGLDVPCKRVDLMADTANTGYIWVGDSGVVANGSGGGIKLGPGDFYSIDVNNLNDIWLIATVDTENISYNYFT
jgi:hypothetical protein